MLDDLLHLARAEGADQLVLQVAGAREEPERLQPTGIDPVGDPGERAEPGAPEAAGEERRLADVAQPGETGVAPVRS